MADKAEGWTRRKWLEAATPEQRRAFYDRQEVSRLRYEAKFTAEEVRLKKNELRMRYHWRWMARKRRRQKAVLRATKWARENPEKARAKRQRYELAHPDRVKASSRAYYHRHKDAVRERFLAREALQDPAQLIEARRKWREGYERKASTWKPSDEQRKAYYRATADTKRLVRRLAAAGLPPRKLTKVPAVQKRANERASAAFFGRKLSVRERDGMLHENATPTILIDTFVRERWNDQFRKEFTAYTARVLGGPQGHKIRIEVGMDQRARELRGVPQLVTELEVYKRASELASRGLTAKLGKVVAFQVLPPGWRAPATDLSSVRGLYER